MGLPTKTVIRASLVFGVAALATAAFVRPAGSPVPARPQPTSTIVAPVERRSAEGFVLTDAAGLLDRVRKSSARGAVISVWASWCGSCKPELPMLLALANTFAGSIDVVLVSADEPDGEPRAKEILDGLHATGPRYVVGEPLGDFKRGMNPRWPGMLPATFLFDRTGRLVYFWGGPVYENEIAPLLRRFLAGEHVDGESNFTLAPGAVTR